jgi:hypothetical protein
MAIHQQEVMETSSIGITKTITADSMSMAMAILQKHQYQFPQKSTIRELAANSLDSAQEKNVALRIISGQAKVEDYYIDRDDPMYKDSQWDPGYYDFKWLWTEGERFTPELQGRDPNGVYITYHDGGNLGKDKLTIEDYGVGLGNQRLLGYFQLLYSTKRNSKFAKGRFGIGAKAAFSTGEPYFTMRSRYNGTEWEFNVYGEKVDPIVPKWDMNTGKENPFIVVPDGDREQIIYYRYITAPNGVMVTLNVKKHHKDRYIDAVKSQLLYFNNVYFTQVENGIHIPVPIKADIIHEDDDMIVSNNSQFSKPHILIDGVNYGFIDFKELELEDVKGNIAVKVRADEVSVNPSRESVIWDDLTKTAVLRAFNRVVDKAGELVSKQLRQTDFFKWIKACASLRSLYRDDNTSLTGKLAQVIDIDKAAPNFVGDERIKFNWILSEILNPRVVKMDVELKGRKKVRNLLRMEASTSASADHQIILRYGDSSARKSKYILDHVSPTKSYWEVKMPERTKEGKFYVGTVISKLKKFQMMDILADCGVEAKIRKVKNKFSLIQEDVEYYDLSEKANQDIIENYLQSIFEFIEKSSEYKVFEKIDVPQSYTGSDKDTDEEILEDGTIAGQESAAERRKLGGKTVLFTPRADRYNSYSAGPTTSLYTLHKIEPHVTEIDNWYADEIYVGNQEHREDIQIAAAITRPEWQISGSYIKDLGELRISGQAHHGSFLPGKTHDDEHACWFYNKQIKLLQVAKENMKYYRDFKHIRQFYQDMQGTTLTMSPLLIKWNTARLIAPHMYKLKFLQNFHEFNVDKATKYRGLVDYIKLYHRPLKDHCDKFAGNSKTDYKHLVTYLDKVFQFQQLVHEQTVEKDQLAQMAKEWFNPAEGIEIEDSKAVELGIYQTLLELVEYADPIYVMLNEVEALARENYQSNLTPTLKEEIRLYLQNKSVKLT